eukprot:jgi/Mesvir1/23624/Mv18300-RA.1
MESSRLLSFRDIREDEIEKADEVQLKTIAHSLLESKLEKMMSTAGTDADLTRTKKLAMEWMRKWDLDGDGVLSSMELKGAAMEHAKLERDYKTRGIWMLVLIVLIVCCGGVILGVSIWANAISKDSEVDAREDLGGETLTKKDGSAVVKTATALYEFRLPRIARVPFDELSTIESISFLYKKTMRQMSVEGFKWYGSTNITFYSPRGERLTIVNPSPISVKITFQEPWASVSDIVFDGPEPEAVAIQVMDAALDDLAARGLPVTLEGLEEQTRPMYQQLWRDVLPEECLLKAEDVLLTRNKSAGADVDQTCDVAILSTFQGFGIVEAKIGPQDYYGTEMTPEEREELTGPSFTAQGGLFYPDGYGFMDRWYTIMQDRVRRKQQGLTN